MQEGVAAFLQPLGLGGRSDWLERQRGEWCCPRTSSLHRPARGQGDVVPPIPLEARRRKIARKRGGRSEDENSEPTLPATAPDSTEKPPEYLAANSGSSLSGLKKPPIWPRLLDQPEPNTERDSSNHPPPISTSSPNLPAVGHVTSENGPFLQCPECRTIYDVHAKDVLIEGRVIQCSICLHQWFGREVDLIESARQAMALFSHQEYQKAAPMRDRAIDAPPPSRKPVPLQETTSISLFVGNLSLYAKVQDLHTAFAAYGAVVRCDIPKGRGGQPRGYGFVEMRRVEDGLHAMQALQGVSIVGREILISKASRKAERGDENDKDADAELGQAASIPGSEDLVAEEEEFFDGDEDDEEFL